MKEKRFAVRTPFGTIWRPRFATAEAAWNRILCRVPPKNHPDWKRRMQELGWHVYEESKAPTAAAR